MIVEIKAYLDTNDVISLLALAMYQQSTESVEAYCQSYKEDNTSVYGSYQGTILVGILVVCMKNVNDYEILNISVKPNYRSQGIAQALIMHVATKLNIHFLYAETDDEAVNFYRRVGFDIEELGQKYVVVHRYRCCYQFK